MPLLGSRGAASLTGFGGLAKLGYLLRNSLRFRASNSASLSRTFSTPTNNKVWTWSGWVKLGTLSAARQILSAGSAISDQIFIGDTNIIRVYLNGGYVFESTPVYRDPASWYHIVIQVDTTQSTAANRTRVYVNGSQVTAFSGTAITQNADTKINSAVSHQLGRYAASASEYFDGYMAEVNFIDGQQLTPSSFGKTDPATGQWLPIKYAGTYGTNGFYLPFSNTASTSTLGNDFSGRGTTWTVNNISLTAGATYDSMTDVPTLTSATAANYCVLNTLDGTNMSYITVSNANLTYSEAASANGWRAIRGTIGVTTGKYRFSVYGTIGASTRMQLGLCTSDSDLGGYNVSHNIGVQYAPYDALYFLNGATTSYGSTQRITAVFDFIFDATTGKCWVAVNGTLLGGNPDAGTGEMATFTTTSTVFPVTQAYGSSWNVNFGQRPWDYTIATASGFKSLNAFNLP